MNNNTNVCLRQSSFIGLNFALFSVFAWLGNDSFNLFDPKIDQFYVYHVGLKSY